jgi:hypothetical protein
MWRTDTAVWRTCSQLMALNVLVALNAVRRETYRSDQPAQETRIVGLVRSFVIELHGFKARGGQCENSTCQHHSPLAAQHQLTGIPIGLPGRSAQSECYHQSIPATFSPSAVRSIPNSSKSFLPVSPLQLPRHGDANPKASHRGL